MAQWPQPPSSWKCSHFQKAWSPRSWSSDCGKRAQRWFRQNRTQFLCWASSWAGLRGSSSCPDWRTLFEGHNLCKSIAFPPCLQKHCSWPPRPSAPPRNGFWNSRHLWRSPCPDRIFNLWGPTDCYSWMCWAFFPSHYQWLCGRWSRVWPGPFYAAEWRNPYRWVSD